jgi:glutathione S-transferase
MLTIHNLHLPQSERIVWLCEALDPLLAQALPVSPLLSPPSLKALTPLDTAPVITDGPFTLAESGAIVEYIYKHGDRRLALSPKPPRLCRLPLLVSLLERQHVGDNRAEHDDQGRTATHRSPSR